MLAQPFSAVRRLARMDLNGTSAIVEPAARRESGGHRANWPTGAPRSSSPTSRPTRVRRWRRRSAARSSPSTSPTPSRSRRGQDRDGPRPAARPGELGRASAGPSAPSARTASSRRRTTWTLYKKVLASTWSAIRLHPHCRHRHEPNDLTDTGERGAIVNMTSVAAFDGQIGQAAYSSSKGGVGRPDAAVARDLSAVGIA